MGMFKKIVLGLLSLIIIAVVGLTIYLNMIDWNKHKTIISRQFSEATGKEVSFDGAVSFSLLPSPYLEADDVNMYNIDADGNKVVLAKISKLVANLSLNSLFRGRFNVDKMKIIKPEIFVEMMESGQLNWESNKPEQDFEITNIDMSFGSVRLEGAKVHFISKKYDFHSVLDNVKADIVADSIFGPYRIEGSYVKRNVPGGFALDLGKFSESFATPVTVVISHPQSESYARFDGTLLLRNDAINGNVTIEAKNPINFANSTFNDVRLSEEYEHPLAMSLAVKSDKNQVELSNVVIKYNGSVGAGNVLIPRVKKKIDGEAERRRVDVAFNMTELNADLVLDAIKRFWNKYDGKDYVPNSEFDVIADVKAVKTHYRDQDIRDLDISVDFVDNVWTLQNMTMQLPYDGIVKAKGEVFSTEKVMTFNFDVDTAVTEFAKTAQWLGYDVKPLSNALYKQASAKFTISGNQQTIKVAPFVFNVDKTGVTGKLGLVRGEKNKYFVIAESDRINFDNYVENMPEDVADKNWEEKIKYRFSQLGGLKDKDVEFRLTLNSGVWGQVPFEKAYAEGVLKNGIMKLNDFEIDEIATAQVALKGEISGFGAKPAVKQMKYGIEIKDNEKFAKKLKMDFPSINLKNLSPLTSKGIVSGDFDRARLKFATKLGDIDNKFNGEVSRGENSYVWDGRVELYSSDFVRMLNNFSIDYHPNYPLGLFRFVADVKGNFDNVSCKNVDTNVGSNNFKGEMTYSKIGKLKSVKAVANANSIEFDKFFYNTNAEEDAFRPRSDKVPFLGKPILSKAKIDYEWLKDWYIDATVKSDSLLIGDMTLKNASWVMKLADSVLNVTQFSADDGDGRVTGEFLFNVPENSRLSGKLSLHDVAMNKDRWSGLSYGLLRGVLNSDFEFSTNMSSFDSALTQLSGKGTFNIVKPLVKGWDMNVIDLDLEGRTSGDGMKVMLQENLSRGETAFDSLSGDFELNGGNFVVNNALFSSDNVDVEATAKGNLGEWMGNASFLVSFKNDPSLEGLRFSLDGTINAPSLDVDVSKLNEVYVQREKKIAEEAKAVENAKVEKYRALMGLQQEFVEKSRISLYEKIMPEYRDNSEKAENKDIKEEYEKLNEKIKGVNSEIRDIVSQKNTPVVTDDLIAKLQKQNEGIADKLKVIAADLRELHLKDVNLRVSDYYGKVVDRVKQQSVLSSDYSDAKLGFEERLSKITTQYAIDKDVKAKNIRQKLERLMFEVEKNYTQVRRDSITAQGIQDAALLENYASNFKSAYELIDKDMDEMKDLIDEYKSHIDAEIRSEEAKYYKKQKEEAIKQKISANTGKIATAGGKTVTFEPDLEDIERMEELIKKEGRRVLDFSDDK